MITLPVLNQDGQQVSTVEIDPADFGGKVNKQLLHDAVVMYQANLRQGTHFAKSRGYVVGTSKKMYRQKGTGHARAGAKRTGKRRGGGTIFGPKPRDYSYALPKRARQLAARMAVLSKFLDNEAVIVQSIKLDQPKTKVMAKVLGSLGLGGAKCLIATGQEGRNVFLSARNIDGVDVLPASDLNAFAVLKRSRLLMTVDALEQLKSRAKADA